MRLNAGLLEMEAAIQETTNTAGCCVTEEALKRFDTDDSPIRVGEVSLAVSGRDPKDYRTPYGALAARALPQTSA